MSIKRSSWHYKLNMRRRSFRKKLEHVERRDERISRCSYVHMTLFSVAAMLFDAIVIAIGAIIITAFVGLFLYMLSHAAMLLVLPHFGIVEIIDLEAAIGFAFIFSVVMIAVVVQLLKDGAMKVVPDWMKPKQSRQPKGRSLFVQYLIDKKNKVCPYIEVVD